MPISTPNFFHAPPLKLQRMRMQRKSLTNRLASPSRFTPPNVLPEPRGNFKHARSSSVSSTHLSSAESRTPVPSSQPWEEELKVRVVADRVAEDKCVSDSGLETEPEDCPGCVGCSWEYKHLHKAVYSHAAALAAVRTAFLQCAATALCHSDL